LTNCLMERNGFVLPTLQIMLPWSHTTILTHLLEDRLFNWCSCDMENHLAKMRSNRCALSRRLFLRLLDPIILPSPHIFSATLCLNQESI
jgi:hypothetical protein